MERCVHFDLIVLCLDKRMKDVAVLLSFRVARMDQMFSHHGDGIKAGGRDFKRGAMEWFLGSRTRWKP